MNIAVGQIDWHNHERTDWDEAKIDLLRKLAADGLSASQIGLVLGLSRNSIVGKCHRIGVKLGRNPSGPKAKRSDPSASHGKPPTALKRQARNATPAGASKKSGGRLGVTHAPDTQGTIEAIATASGTTTHGSVSLNQTLVRRLDEPRRQGNPAAAFANKRRFEEARLRRLAAEAKAAQSPAALARMACFDANPGGVRLEDLQPHHCRWPGGEGKRVRFCGEPQEGLGPYCRSHALLAYAAPVQRPKRDQGRQRPNLSFGV